MGNRLINHLTKNEYEKIIHEFNPNKSELCEDIDVVTWFEQVVQKYPQREAISISGEVLSYEELNQRANHVAKILVNANIEKEDLVGIILNRSIQLVVAILGVLKSGAAFLPIDSENPQERVKYIIEDSNVKQVITDTASCEKWGELLNRKIVAPNFVYLHWI